MSFGSWGFKGQDERGLEFPEGEGVSAAPADRARIRYNNEAKQLEASIDGGAYSPLTLGAASAALSQATFFIDPIDGNDSNSGETAATAIKTWGEYAARTGDGTVSVYQVITLLNDLTEDVVVRGYHPMGMEVYGKRTTIYSGTVSGAQSWNTTLSPIVDGEITDAGLPGTWSNSGPGGTSLVGKMIIMTSGPNVGKVAHVLKDLGGKTARIGQLVDPLTFATGNPLIGNTFDVLDLTTLNGQIRMFAQDVAGTGYTGFYFLEIVDSASPIIGRSGSLDIAWDVVRQTTSSGESLTCDFTATGVLFKTNLQAESMNGSFGFFACSFLDAQLSFTASEGAFGLINAHQAVVGGIMGNATFLTLDESRVTPSGGSYGSLDIVTAGQTLVRSNPMSQIDVRSGGRLWGLGQTNGYGVFIDSFAVALWPAGGSAPTFYEFDVSGAAVEFRLGGTSTDAATLGAAGTIVAANNAGAVRRTS